MKPHSPAAVANEMLARAHASGRSITPLELQKLVYLAQGWTLAVNGTPLIDAEPEAWEWGPVYPPLYDALKRYGTGPVTEQVTHAGPASDPSLRGRPAVDSFTPEERQILDKVWLQYGALRDFQLAAFTSDSGTPWSSIYQPGRKLPIPNDALKSQFLGLATSKTP